MFLPILLSLRPQWTYTAFNIYGWTVEVGSDELADPLWPQVEGELSDQLYRISRVVPDAPLAKLRTIKFWVHRADPAVPCMAYHPGAQWLSENGTDPGMAKGVELSNAANYIGWTHQQPWMALHELSHAYHDQFLPKGFDNPDIKKAWDDAMKAKIYDHVLHYSGSMAKHYAETNQMEYFAESTESYFGTNDFYPFVNAELKTYDPETYALMVKFWGKPVERGVPIEPLPEPGAVTHSGS